MAASLIWMIFRRTGRSQPEILRRRRALENRRKVLTECRRCLENRRRALTGCRTCPGNRRKTLAGVREEEPEDRAAWAAQM